MSFQFNNPSIIGTWKIKSYDAIDNIKQSPAYKYGVESTRSQVDQMFLEILTKGEYHFEPDTLRYSDLEKTKLVIRRAIWKINQDILTISEIDRPFEREALIRKLTADSLIISPIIEGVPANSRIRFVRK